MKRGKWIALAIGLLLALVALWYFASPAWTLKRMQAAAKAGDGDAIVAMIDFPALREDVRGELTKRLAAEAERNPDSLAGIGAALGGAVMGPLVERIVSPAAVQAALTEKDGEDPRANQERSRLPGLKIPKRPVIVRKSWSEFLLASEDDRNAGLVFRREGLGWKLAGVELPAKDGN